MKFPGVRILLQAIPRILAWLVVAEILAGCASKTTLPPIPPTARALAHPPAKFLAPKFPELQLTWDYDQPMPASNIVFEVYQSPNLKHWSLLTTVEQPPVFLGGSGSMFFTVRSLNTVTGLRGE